MEDSEGKFMDSHLFGRNLCSGQAENDESNSEYYTADYNFSIKDGTIGYVLSTNSFPITKVMYGCLSITTASTK